MGISFLFSDGLESEKIKGGGGAGKSPILGLTSYYGYVSGLTLLFSFYFFLIVWQLKRGGEKQKKRKKN
jgi:hypothetical protein